MNTITMNKEIILKEFCNLCNEHKIWYSIDGYGILSAITNYDFNSHEDNYEVMMTYESYEKLKQLFPEKILDNTTYSGYHSKQIKFITKMENIYHNFPFLNINIVVPTTIKKVKKYLNWRNKMKNWIYNNLSFKDTNLKSIKFKKKISKFLSFFIKKHTYKQLVNILYDKNHEGFYVISNKNKNIVNCWINNLTQKTVLYKIKNVEVSVIYEYNEYMQNVFSNNYLETKIPEKKYQYINVVDYVQAN